MPDDSCTIVRKIMEAGIKSWNSQQRARPRHLSNSYRKLRSSGFISGVCRGDQNQKKPPPLFKKYQNL